MATGANLRRTPVIVARAPAGQYAWIPDVTNLGGGQLLAVYRQAPGGGPSGDSDGYVNGSLQLVRSNDDGLTWSKPWVVVQDRYDDRDGKLARLRDGTLLLSYFETDWAASPLRILGSFVVRSNDNGRHWSAPAPVGTTMSCGCGSAAGGATGNYAEGFAATHGEIVQLPNGELLLPLYGTKPDDRYEQATVVRSVDDGRSWSAKTESVIAAQDGSYFQEPVLSVLADGEVVALLRTLGLASLSRSYDGGRTWSAPEPTDMAASSAHLLNVTGGGALLTYGDTSGRFTNGRPTVGRLIQRPELSWNGLSDTLLYAVGSGANPSSVQLWPGYFLTLTYDLRLRAIVGVYSDLGDYRWPSTPPWPTQSVVIPAGRVATD